MGVLYPGSFDPITNGHVDVIRRLARAFPKVHVAVLSNPDKSSWFSVKERMEMIRKSLRGLKNVRVTAYEGLLVDYAKRIGVRLVARGLRAVSDFDSEFKMALANKDMAPAIDTLFMLTDKKYAFLSSSLVKEIALYGGPLKSFVPPPAERALRSKVKERAAGKSAG
ncbi:pantetheine-phosphate adenylyltransferase [bacterium]|nr:pantetheine-phosphate adenylyltransferase [bacterium]